MKLLAFTGSLIAVAVLAGSAHAQSYNNSSDSSNTQNSTAKKKRKAVTIDAEPVAPATGSNSDKETGAPIPERPDKKKTGDIDDEITNAKLRAQTGAKRKLSFQSSFYYNGATINDPLSSERPKLTPGTVAPQPSNINGTLAAKYRVTEHDQLSLGIGVNWERPLHHGTTGTEYGEVADPYLAYNRLFKAGPVQNVFEIIGQLYTNRNSTGDSDVAEFDIDHTIVYGIPKSSWQLGLNVAYTHDFFSLNALSNAGDPVDVVAAFPYVEYEFNQTFSFRTVYRGATFYTTLGNLNTFTADIPTESLGIGIAITRDIYLYPNVQWVWSAISANRTNCALSANINL